MKPHDNGVGAGFYGFPLQGRFGFARRSFFPLHSRFAVLLAAAALVVAAAPAARAQNGDPPPAAPFSTSPATPDESTVLLPTVPAVTVLPGGARLVTLYEPRAPLVTMDVFFRAGTPDENGNESGIASLIARAWFGDTASRTARLQQFEIERQGGGLGAIAWGELTELWSVSGADPAELEKAARTLLLNIVSSPRFERATVDEARAELLRDLTMNSDNAGEAAIAALKRRIWQDASYGSPPDGTPESVARLTPAQLQRFYTRFFRPNRAVFVVAGNITPDAARDLVRSNLNAGGWLEGPSAPPMRAFTSEQVRPGLRPVSLARGGQAGITVIGYVAPGTENNGKAYATLLLLDAVLGGGKSARLFRDLRDGNGGAGDGTVAHAAAPAKSDTEAATAPGAATSNPNNDADTDVTATPPVGYDIRTTIQTGTGQSLWAVYVSGTRDAADVEAAVKRELVALADGTRPVTDAELSRARAFLFRERAQKRQRLKDRAFRTGWAEAMGLGAPWEADFEQTLAPLTANDINQLAHTLLTAPSATVSSR